MVTAKKRGRRKSTSSKASMKKKSTASSQKDTAKAEAVGRPWDNAEGVSKSELIRKYAVTYPNAKAAEIAVALGKGFTRPYVQQILWTWKQKQKGVKVIKRLSELDELKLNHKNHIDAHMKLIHAATSGKSVNDGVDIDMVNHPPHYTKGGIETIDFIEAKQLPYNLGNVIKYITRADHKGNRLEDLQKARWYLDREITRVTPPLP